MNEQINTTVKVRKLTKEEALELIRVAEEQNNNTVEGEENGE